MSNMQFHAEIHTGEYAEAYLKSIQGHRVLIVCDSFLAQNGSVNYLTQNLEGRNEIEIFSDVRPDPSTLVVQQGMVAMLRFTPTIVIGFGGGSAIDTVKALVYFAEMKQMMKKPLFIAVPTTSGTGSEVTSVTVITDADTHVKNVLQDTMMLPDVVLLNPALTLTVPKAVTANTGIDVLTHALEAYVAKGHNVFGDALAEKSIELVLKSLVACYQNGNDMEHRKNLQEASTLAGMAFNNAGLGANHAVAHQLGGMFRIPHGLANGVALVAVIDANSRNQAVFQKYASLARHLMLVDAAAEDTVAVAVLKGVIRGMMEKLDMPLSVAACGVDKKDYFAQIDQMAEQAMGDFTMPMNAEFFTKMDVCNILKAIY